MHVQQSGNLEVTGSDLSEVHPKVSPCQDRSNQGHQAEATSRMRLPHGGPVRSCATHSSHGCHALCPTVAGRSLDASGVENEVEVDEWKDCGRKMEEGKLEWRGSGDVCVEESMCRVHMCRMYSTFTVLFTPWRVTGHRLRLQFWASAIGQQFDGVRRST